MLKFIVMLPFRILFLPVVLVLKLTFWLCTGLLCMAEWIFGLASGILVVLSILGMIWVSVPQGIVMLGIAFLISPSGIPMLAMKLFDAYGSDGRVCLGNCILTIVRKWILGLSLFL